MANSGPAVRLVWICDRSRAAARAAGSCRRSPQHAKALRMACPDPVGGKVEVLRPVGLPNRAVPSSVRTISEGEPLAIVVWCMAPRMAKGWRNVRPSSGIFIPGAGPDRPVMPRIDDLPRRQPQGSNLREAMFHAIWAAGIVRVRPWAEARGHRNSPCTLYRFGTNHLFGLACPDFRGSVGQSASGSS